MDFFARDLRKLASAAIALRTRVRQSSFGSNTSAHSYVQAWLLS